MIIKMGIKAVITMDKISDPAENIFEENMAPVIPANSVKMTSMSEFYLVNSKDFNMEIERWKETRKRSEENRTIIKIFLNLLTVSSPEKKTINILIIL